MSTDAMLEKRNPDVAVHGGDPLPPGQPHHQLFALDDQLAERASLEISPENGGA